MLRVAAVELLGLPRLLEPAHCVLADRLQHPEPIVCVAEKALVDERLERVEIGVGHLLGVAERAAAGEGGEPGEGLLLGRCEQLVAPVDRRAQRALALGQVSGAAGQQRQALRQALEDLAGRERLDARGGELERERQIVEATADLRDRFVALEVGLDRPAPVPGRGRRPPRARAAAPRRPAPRSRAAAPCSSRADRGWDRRRATRPRPAQRRRPARSCRRRSATTCRRCTRRDRPRRRAPARRSPRPAEGRGAAQAVSTTHRVGTARPARRRCAAQGGVLPVPPGAGQREQPHVRARQLGERLGQLVPAPQERSRRAAGDSSGGDVSSGGKSSVSELVDPLGLGQILQAVVAEVAEPTGPDELGGRGRDQHLPAVTAGGDPRRPVHVHPDVALLANARGAGVDSNPQPDRARRQPVQRLCGCRSAPWAVGNATKNESPCVSTSTPS